MCPSKITAYFEPDNNDKNIFQIYLIGKTVGRKFYLKLNDNYDESALENLRRHLNENIKVIIMKDFMISPTSSNQSHDNNQCDPTDPVMQKIKLEPTLSFQSNDAYTIVSVPLK